MTEVGDLLQRLRKLGADEIIHAPRDDHGEVDCDVAAQEIVTRLIEELRKVPRMWNQEQVSFFAQMLSEGTSESEARSAKEPQPVRLDVSDTEHPR